MTESLSTKSQPPLRARLHRYLLTTAEFALLTAMAEHCSDGSTIYASIPRLAAYAKLSRRHVERLIHGYVDDRTETHIAGLTDRGILTELAPHNGRKRRPATYRLNEDALQLDPRMRPYLHQEAQRMLPGILKVPKLGTPTAPSMDLPSDAPPARCQAVASQKQSGALSTGCQEPPLTASLREAPFPQSPCQGSTVTVSDDSKAIDPVATARSKTIQEHGIHHADTTLNSLPAWMAAKTALRGLLSEEEWDLWVRPMYLLKLLEEGPGKGKHLLAALPPVSKIISAAQARLPLLRELLAPAGLNVSLTCYPDQWEIEEANRRYGLDMAPCPWRGA